MFSQARVCLIDFRRFDELAPRSVREQRDRTEFATILQMSEDFAGDALLILVGQVVRKMRTMLDERFLRLGGFAVNETDEADQLVPGLAVRVAVLSGVNRGEFPLFLPGSGSTACLKLAERTSSSSGEPCAAPDCQRSERNS